ncbi:MAG: hypothetical protein QF807_07075 [Candidatus Thalassarchaeaceae archaeon]|nr:hypothetical protein [Candidatus Thalassarchaeaceae archaeon]MDP7043759.1 hypothetical protein [Candidatus Thalassarchaeaceae archaeon]
MTLAISLAILLAISPNIFLGGQGTQISEISHDDLSESQIAAIITLEPATISGEIARGATVIRDVSQTDDGSLVIAGTFVNSVSFGNFSLTSNGSRDIFIGELDIEGVWLWVASGGGVGQDDVVDLTILEDHIQLVGLGHGSLSFGDKTAVMTLKYGQDAWWAEISHSGDWSETWRIDPIFLPQTDASIWCGFR